MSDRIKGQPVVLQSIEKAVEGELLYLCTYIKRCPYSIQKQLLPYCFELKKDYPSDARLKELCDSLIGEA